MVRHYLYLALSRHIHCTEREGLSTFDAWTVVPSMDSTRSYSSHEHPLYYLVDSALSRCRVDLPHFEVNSCRVEKEETRIVDAEHFTLASKNTAARHILVFEDTWVSGGHLSSLALRLQKTLGTAVSVLTIARFINQENYSPSAELMAQKKHGELTSYRSIEHCLWSADGHCL